MTEEPQKFEVKSTAVAKIVDPMIDPGNLLLIDRDPIEEADVSENLLHRARNNTQLLFNNIWELDKKHVDSAICAVLPLPALRLPREKKIPEAKEPTKWESYAAKKGIEKKKKKSRQTFDETTKEWKPTYGYNKANDQTKDWLIELKSNADLEKDHFAELVEKKKERVAKNELQRLKNLAKSLKTKIKTGPSIDTNIGVGIKPEDKTKAQVRFAVDRAKAATASAGKYQRLARGEKENIKTGVKRHFTPNEIGGSNEKERALTILTKMKAKKAKIIEEKAAGIAGPEIKPKKEKKGKKKNAPVRQKNQIDRQRFFNNKLEANTKTRGNSLKNAKAAGRTKTAKK